MPGQDPSPPTRRVVRIMELLADRHSAPVTLAEICRDLDISRSTGHAIMQTLCDCRWALRDPLSGRFSLGPAVASVGGLPGSPTQLMRESLHQLRSALHLPVCVSEVRNGAIVVAESAAASGSRAPVAAGAKLPFVAPFGREFVAWSSKREQKQWVAAAGPVTDTFRRRIDLVLAEIRHRGYGIERLSDPLLRVFAALKAIDNQAPPDAVSTRLAAAVADLTVVDYLPEELAEAEGSRLATISAPIFDHAGSVVMTVSAQPYSPLTRSQIEDIGAHVIEFARSAEAVIRSSTTAHRLTMGRPG